MKTFISRIVFFGLFFAIQIWAVQTDYEREFSAIYSEANQRFDEFQGLRQAFNEQNDGIISEAMVDQAGAWYNSVRHPLVFKYSWAIPNNEALKTIKEYSPVIELGAGSGYWAHLLSKLGANIIAFDNYADADTPYAFTHYWMKPINKDEACIDEHPHRTLLLCWPDPRSEAASKALKRYLGKYVIYIGPPNCKYVADSSFFSMLASNFKLIQKVAIPQWPGINDALFVFERL